jgi:PAB-dependent poly(A)-specific ribonuclease subunit 2
MTSLSVEPSKVRDTVELFCPTPAHRRLRLRFLASYLLGLSIQGSEASAAAGAGAAAAAAGHDSVEDARTALRLYREWERLRDCGQLDAKIEEMYAWGKMHGWGPVVRDANGVMHPSGGE